MALKKVLIITYYWPPSAGPGLYRVSKFCKYLKDFGWEPIVLTANEANSAITDGGSVSDIDAIKVYKTKIFEPTSFIQKLSKGNKAAFMDASLNVSSNTSLKTKVISWIRANLFIPDAKIGWIPFAVAKGKSIIRKEKPDIIFSCSPPPTVHLIAKKLAKYGGIKWVADFRDPWTQIYYYDNMKQSNWARRKNESLELETLRKADWVTVVNKGFFSTDEFKSKIQKLTNGYDSEELKAVKVSQRDNKFTIRYFGRLQAMQLAPAFFECLSILGQDEKYNQLIKFELYGKMDTVVQEKFKSLNIQLECNFYDFIPRQQAVNLMASTDVLLMIIGQAKTSKIVYSLKLFEYLMMKRNILAFAPRGGSVDELLTDTGAGKSFEFEETDLVLEYVKEQFALWKEGKKHNSFNESEISKYDVRNLTKELATVFENLTKH